MVSGETNRLTGPLTRRVVLSGLAAATLAPQAVAAAPPKLRVGALIFGAVDWEIQTIVAGGLDKRAGVDVEAVPLAGNEAARIAFLSGSVDTIVTDLLLAARLRSEGMPIRFLPYSTSEGRLLVKAGSPIKTISDLAGKSIGVAGGALDKSWLLLQAAAKKQGLDLANAAKPMFGAPPLLSLKLENGELDACLLYWTAAARLQAESFRTVVTVEEIAEQLGAKGSIAFTGYVFKDTLAQTAQVGFAKAVREAEAKMANDPATWTRLRPLMKAPDEATFEALKNAFVHGIPHKPRDAEIADARAFYATLAALGGPALVGKATTLPDGLYADREVYG